MDMLKSDGVSKRQGIIVIQWMKKDFFPPSSASVPPLHFFQTHIAICLLVAPVRDHSCTLAQFPPVQIEIFGAMFMVPCFWSFPCCLCLSQCLTRGLWWLAFFLSPRQGLDQTRDLPMFPAYFFGYYFWRLQNFRKMRKVRKIMINFLNLVNKITQERSIDATREESRKTFCSDVIKIIYFFEDRFWAIHSQVSEQKWDHVCVFFPKMAKPQCWTRLWRLCAI